MIDPYTKDILNRLFSLQIHAAVYLKKIDNKLKYNNIDLKDIFECLDADNNGFLTLDEV